MSPDSVLSLPQLHKDSLAISRNRAFTLMEVLVAMVIFGLITFALSFAFTSALNSQVSVQNRQDENGRVRVVFDALSRDIQSAYISKTDQASVFYGSSGGSGGQQSQNPDVGGLLTVSALTHRIQANDPGLQDTSSSVAGSPSNSSMGQPQSDQALIRYDQDPQTGYLTRFETAIPNGALLGAATPGPATILCQNVVSLTLQFWDPSQGSWRTDWDYEAANQAQTATAGSAGATGQSSSTSATSTTTGDTFLPQFVQASLTLMRPDQSKVTYVTEIPVIATLYATQANGGTGQTSASSTPASR